MKTVRWPCTRRGTTCTSQTRQTRPTKLICSVDLRCHAVASASPVFSPLAAPITADAKNRIRMWPSERHVEGQIMLSKDRLPPPEDVLAIPGTDSNEKHGRWLGWPQNIWDNYRLDQGKTLLGAGAFGQVFLGSSVVDGHPVAIKMVNKDRPDIPWQDYAGYLKNEVHIWTLCQPSKSVVRLEGCYEDKTHAYMVQELCTGGDLRSVLKDGTLTEQEAAQVMLAVLDAVHECHTHHYSYGDIKPANFLLKHPRKATASQSTPASPNVESCHQPSATPSATAPASYPGATGSSSSSDGEQVLQISSAVVAANEGISVTMDARVPLADGTSTALPISGKARHMAAAAMAATKAVHGGGMTSSPTHSRKPVVANNAVPLSMPTLKAHTSSNKLGAASNTRNEPSAPGSAPLTDPAPLTVRACDFGCSQPLTSRTRCSSISTKRVGSPVYMAPELWQGGGAMGLAIDMWACGVMLYQLLSGKYPFWDKSPEEIDEKMAMYQVVCGVSSNPVITSGEPWAHISRPCKSLIMAMLERDPAQRITAMQALESPWFKRQLGYTPKLTSMVNPYASLASMESAFDLPRITPNSGAIDSFGQDAFANDSWQV